MKKNAPHLPPKTCLIDYNHRLHDFRLIIYSVLVAIASGAAASLILFNYFYPTDVGVNSVYVNSNRNISGSFPSLDAAVVRDWRYQIVQIYDESKIIQPGIYPASSFIGKGVVLNSGGWVALYEPSWVSSKASRMIGVDYLGIRFPIEKYIFDKENGLVYLKFKGEFHGTTVFSDWKNTHQNQPVWVVNGEWDTGSMTMAADDVGATLPVKKFSAQYHISNYSPHGGPVVDSRGSFMGFVDASGSMIPSWLIEHNIISILNTGDLDKSFIDWRGFFVTGAREGINWKEVNGFYISDSAEKASATKVGKGDILLKINDEPVTKFSLARQIISAQIEFSATVLRDGAEIKMTAVKARGK